MFRILLAGATFLAVCAVSVPDATAAGAQRTGATGVASAAPVVQVYTNPG